MEQAALVTSLQGFKGQIVNLAFNNGDELLGCFVCAVFKSVARPGAWVVIIDNGKQQSLDIATIKDVQSV